jgi:hypothetical protein
MGGPRTDFTYPRVIEAELRAAGLPAEVRVSARPGALAKESLETWEDEVVPWSPDVVIVHYGQVESIHRVLPSWAEHYVNALHRRPGKLRDLYYRTLVKKVWLGLANGQKWIDARVEPTRLWRRHRVVAAHVERLISRVRNVARPLVLVPDLLQPGPPWANWFPGMGARVDLMNATLDELVDRIADPEVQRFRITDVAAGIDGEPTPDGGHFTPELHQAIGAAMANVIFDWASGQPHLAGPATQDDDVVTPITAHLTAVTKEHVS